MDNLWRETYVKMKNPLKDTSYFAPEAVIRKRLKACNQCPFFAQVNGGGCMAATGDCVECLNHRDAMIDVAAYSKAKCPKGRF